MSVPSPTSSSHYSFTPAPTPAAHFHSSSSSPTASSVFHFRTSSIAPLARSTSPLPSSPFQVMDHEDEERMRQIQQLAKRRRSSLLRPDTTTSYSLPSPKAASALSTSFAQLSLRPTQPPVVAPVEPAVARVPSSARRLFSLEVGSEGRESSRSSRKGSLKRAHDSDEDDYSQQRADDELGNGSSTLHVEEEQKQQEPEPHISASILAHPAQPIVAASHGLFDKRTFRERPRRWTTGLMATQHGRAAEGTGGSSEQTRAARPITPYVNSGVQPVKPTPRSLFLQTTEEDLDDSCDITHFSFDMPTPAPYAGKRASLTSSHGASSFLPLPPQSRPPTPLAPASKRSTLPATFRLSSLASLAESITARTEDEQEEDGTASEKYGTSHGAVDEKQVSANEKPTSVFTWSAALPPAGADLRSIRAGSQEGRRRSLAMAGARALVGGAQF